MRRSRLGLWLDRLRGSGAGLYFAGAAVLALVAGLLAAGAVRAAAPSATVWVAARDLPPGSELSAADFRQREVPAAARPAGAVADQHEVVGRRLRYGLAAGDVVRAAHLVEAESDLAARLAEQGPEMRAVLLPPEVVGAPERLAPGEQLDLVAILPLRTETEQTHAAVQLGQATVLEVVRDYRDEAVGVLAAIPAEVALRYTLAARAGDVAALVRPGGSEELDGMEATTTLRVADLLGDDREAK